MITHDALCHCPALFTRGIRWPVRSCSTLSVGWYPRTKNQQRLQRTRVESRPKPGKVRTSCFCKITKAINNSEIRPICCLLLMQSVHVVHACSGQRIDLFLQQCHKHVLMAFVLVSDCLFL